MVTCALPSPLTERSATSRFRPSRLGSALSRSSSTAPIFPGALPSAPKSCNFTATEASCAIVIPTKVKVLPAMFSIEGEQRPFGGVIVIASLSQDSPKSTAISC